MELVLVEHNAGVEIDATEYAEVTGAELVGSTKLGSGRGRQMEHGHDGRRESGQWANDAGGAGTASGTGRVCSTSRSGMGERELSGWTAVTYHYRCN
jgi:hypothetical protein